MEEGASSRSKSAGGERALECRTRSSNGNILSREGVRKTNPEFFKDPSRRESRKRTKYLHQEWRKCFNARQKDPHGTPCESSTGGGIEEQRPDHSGLQVVSEGFPRFLVPAKEYAVSPTG